MGRIRSRIFFSSSLEKFRDPASATVVGTTGYAPPAFKSYPAATKINHPELPLWVHYFFVRRVGFEPT